MQIYQLRGGWTALMAAIPNRGTKIRSKNSNYIVALLLEYGADANKPQPSGMTPLISAIMATGDECT